LILPCWGTFVGPDEELLHKRNWPQGAKVFHNAVIEPQKDRTMDYFRYDTNLFKTEVHKAWNAKMGLKGSLSMFRPDHISNHKPIADHCNSEYPKLEIGKRTTKNKIIWSEKTSQVDNEYFDNLTACFALLSTFGIDIKPGNKAKMTDEEKGMDMAEFMRSMKNNKL